jgi:hypothetical protein
MRMSKDIPDDLLMGAGVYDLDPGLPILACQAAALLGQRPAHAESAPGLTLGSVLKRRGKPAPAAKRVQRTFQAFVAEGPQGTGTWPMLRVDGFPIDLFASLSLGLHPDRVDPEGVEDMTLGQILEERASFYRQHPRGWGAPATQPGPGPRVMHLTSLAEAERAGYESAIKVLFQAPPLTEPELKALPQAQQAATRAEQNARRQLRRNLMAGTDYKTVRQALDAQPDDFYMSRTMVQFYLRMSPASFKQALARGDHPFGNSKAGRVSKAGATKGEVDAWFARVVAEKWKREPTIKPLRRGRDLETGRPYLVDDTGTILADAEVSTLDPGDVAYAISLGASLRVLSTTRALGEAWRCPEEKKPWKSERFDMLMREADEAMEAVAAARRQDLGLTTPLAVAQVQHPRL